MASVRKLDHIAVAVSSIPDALGLFRDVLGGRFVAGGDDEALGIRTLQLAVGDGKVELMEPLGDDSHLRRFLDERGPGFHHLTMFVDDLPEMIGELEEGGYEVVDTALDRSHWRETFVRPRSGFGTLLQVVETDRRWDVPADGLTIEDVVAGRVVWRDGRPVRR